MSNNITRRSTLLRILVGIGVAVIISMVFPGNRIFGQTNTASKTSTDPVQKTPAQEAIGNEYADSLIAIPTKFEKLSPAVIKELELREDIDDILDGLDIRKNGKRITSMSVKQKDDIIQASAKVEHEIKECLRPLGGLHPLEDVEQTEINNFNMWFLGCLLSEGKKNPKVKIADIEPPSGVELQKVFYNGVHKRGITTLDKGWECRNVWIQHIMFRTTIEQAEKKRTPNQEKERIRELSWQYFISFDQPDEEEKPLAFYLSDREIYDAMRRRNRQTLVNAVIANNGSIDGIEKDLRGKGIFLTPKEVEKAVQWLADLDPFCKKLGRLDRICKTGMLGDKPLLFMFGEKHYLDRACAHACIMKVMQQNKLLAVFMETESRNQFTDAYEGMCYTLTTSSITTCCRMYKGLFGDPWEDHCFYIDDKSKGNYERSGHMLGEMISLLQLLQGQSVFTGNNGIFAWIGGAGHLDDLFNVGDNAAQATLDELSEKLHERFLPISFKVYTTDTPFGFDRFDIKPQELDKLRVVEILNRLFRDAGIQESFAGSFDPSNDSIDKKIRKWSIADSLVEGIDPNFGSRAWSIARKEQQANLKNIFDPSPFVTDPGVGAVGSQFNPPSGR